MTKGNLNGGPRKTRDRLTNERKEQLDQQIVDVLKEDNPQSVRHVFYRMTDPRLPEPVPKDDPGYNRVQRRLVELRRSGRVPYHWITDSTRRGYFVNTFTDASDFIRAHAGLFRADIWSQSDYLVEVWVESRSIGGIVEDLCREYAVSLYPCGGFASISMVHQAAVYINESIEETGRKPIILVITDYDPAGELIDEKIQEELGRHLIAPLECHRVGITLDQIKEHDLPTKPRKKSDKRAQHIKSTVEAEAMPAALLRDYLRDHIERYMPQHALEVAQVAEQSEQQHLFRMADLMEAGRYD